MKQFFVILLVFFGSNLSYSQVLTPDLALFDDFLSEVYVGVGAQEVQEGTRKYDYFKELFANRIKYMKATSEFALKHPSVPFSSIELNRTYTSDIVRDVSFDAYLFNPFKYHLNFYSKKIQVIQFEFSDYVMVIYPQIISSRNRP